MAIARVVDVIIAPEYDPNDFGAKSYKNLHIDVEVQRSIMQEMNTAKATIFNLSIPEAESINVLDYLQIRAGYEGDIVETIYSGYIYEIRMRKEGVDHITEIFAITTTRSVTLQSSINHHTGEWGYYQPRNVPIDAVNYPVGYGYDRMLQDMCNAVNIAFMPPSLTTSSDGDPLFYNAEPFSGTGTFETVMKKISKILEHKDINYSVFVDNNQCVLYSLDGSTPLTIAMLREDSGILSVTKVKTQQKTLGGGSTSTSSRRAELQGMRVDSGSVKKAVAKVRAALKKWYDFGPLQHPAENSKFLYGKAVLAAIELSAIVSNSYYDKTIIWWDADCVAYWLDNAFGNYLIAPIASQSDKDRAFEPLAHTKYIAPSGKVSDLIQRNPVYRAAQQISGRSALLVARNCLHLLDQIDKNNEALLSQKKMVVEKEEKDFAAQQKEVQSTLNNAAAVVKEEISLLKTWESNKAAWGKRVPPTLGATSDRITDGVLVPISKSIQGSAPVWGKVLQAEKEPLLQGIYNVDQGATARLRGATAHLTRSVNPSPGEYAGVPGSGYRRIVRETPNSIMVDSWYINRRILLEKLLPLLIAAAKKVGGYKDLSGRIPEVQQVPSRVFYLVEALFHPHVRPNGVLAVPFQQDGRLEYAQGEFNRASLERWQPLALLVEAVAFKLSNYQTGEGTFNMTVEGSLLPEFAIHGKDSMVASARAKVEAEKAAEKEARRATAAAKKAAREEKKRRTAALQRKGGS